MKYIPNGRSWVGFLATLTGTLDAPKVADISAAINLTPVIMGMTASTTGQAVPTGTFDTTFETSIPGTVSATFSMDGYRDDTTLLDLMWTTLPRGTNGFVIVSRAVAAPIVGTKVEVWPISVLARSVAAMAKDTPVSVNISASVPVVPHEDAVVVT